MSQQNQMWKKPALLGAGAQVAGRLAELDQARSCMARGAIWALGTNGSTIYGVGGGKW